MVLICNSIDIMYTQDEVVSTVSPQPMAKTGNEPTPLDAKRVRRPQDARELDRRDALRERKYG